MEPQITTNDDGDILYQGTDVTIMAPVAEVKIDLTPKEN